jgi:hypothetical protein
MHDTVVFISSLYVCVKEQHLTVLQYKIGHLKALEAEHDAAPLIAHASVQSDAPISVGDPETQKL